MSNIKRKPIEYSLNDPYSSHASLNEATRLKKATKITSVLEKHVDLAQCDLLDIGTGSGHIVQLISKKCKTATSVNLNDERIVKEGYTFIVVDDVYLPFDNESFDVVISNQVIEHIPVQDIHINEIYRVLKKGGIAYIATPSKYTLIEPHFKLPFLSWLPRSLSNFYVKLFNHKKWDIYPLTLGKLMKMVMPKFEIEDMSLKIIKHPKDYQLDMFPLLQPLLKILPVFILRLLHPFLPSFIVILHKKQ